MDIVHYCHSIEENGSRLHICTLVDCVTIKKVCRPRILAQIPSVQILSPATFVDPIHASVATFILSFMILHKILQSELVNSWKREKEEEKKEEKKKEEMKGKGGGVTGRGWRGKGKKKGRGRKREGGEKGRGKKGGRKKEEKWSKNTIKKQMEKKTRREREKEKEKRKRRFLKQGRFQLHARTPSYFFLIFVQLQFFHKVSEPNPMLHFGSFLSGQTQN